MAQAPNLHREQSTTPLVVKQPGLEMSTVQSELDLSYRQPYQGITIPEAYERLILDTIKGDQQHFVRRDELKASWEIFTPLLHHIDKREFKPIPYKPGSRGAAAYKASFDHNVASWCHPRAPNL
ncbi:glucose-6-phosphate 1-dehydrogenase, cytoplasmic isoform-like isoform X2 [Gastrolobium bilobum]|uniref:glucose-6-phosphate 1-dehydrogenase, cytoplasmic isoform-like isoform X2 n=1 Tax=Gastrolobium bilobum TaxID=150636 RepID=UPI002AB09CC2|nr:glucose-6-phosphate 1-dehydrogenase, cytoplasmic isoform-like isoform X2 [Gastrolobium bilobum]